MKSSSSNLEYLIQLTKIFASKFGRDQKRVLKKGYHYSRLRELQHLSIQTKLSEVASTLPKSFSPAASFTLQRFKTNPVYAYSNRLCSSKTDFQKIMQSGLEDKDEESTLFIQQRNTLYHFLSALTFPGQDCGLCSLSKK